MWLKSQWTYSISYFIDLYIFFKNWESKYKILYVYSLRLLWAIFSQYLALTCKEDNTALSVSHWSSGKLRIYLSDFSLSVLMQMWKEETSVIVPRHLP